MTHEKVSNEPNEAYEKTFLGSVLVGIEVTTRPQRSAPAPNATHHIHNSSDKADVENATPPNWTITI